MQKKVQQEDKEFIRAKDYAFRLLGYRQRSRKELKERLQKKGFSPEVSQKTIKYLSRLNYLNDEEFARFWIRSRIETSPCGLALLRYQLRQKGVEEETLDKVFSEFSGQYNEFAAARKLVEMRCKRYLHLKPLKQKRRLYAYLRRRGFSQEAILAAIE